MLQKIGSRFEQGHGRYLIFRDNAYGEYELKTNKSNQSTLESQKSSGYSHFFEFNKGEIEYEGMKFYTSPYNNSKLKIKKKETSKMAITRRKISGVKVQ